MDQTAKQKENWTVMHTLTEQDMRQLILEKLERARLLQLAKVNRELNKELA